MQVKNQLGEIPMTEKEFCPFITKSLCITYKVNLIISLWKRLQIFFIIVLDKLEFDGEIVWL